MIFRSLLLLLPLSIWALLIFNQRLSVREITASFLGFVWAFQASLILNMLALKAGVWTFLIDDNLFYDTPLDWVLAQAIITGALAPLTRLWGWNMPIRLSLQAALIATIYISTDLVFVDAVAGWGILLIIFVSSGLALLLSDWTARDTQILGRALLQSLAWASVLFWLFPSTVFYLTAENWNRFVQRDLILNGLYLLPLLIPAYLLSSALYQFAKAGGGTAFPYDPPKRLVTSGIYRYLSNPMQLGICLAMGWWGIVLGSAWITLSALIAVILFVVFKDVCNGSCAIGVGNQEWENYQAAVPKWWPRFRPWEQGSRR